MPIETAISGGIESYIRLVWLFTIFIIILLLLLSYLYLSIKKVREREFLSMEFSKLMIEGLETERLRISRELHDTVLPLVREGQVPEIIRSICVNLMPPDFSCLSLKDALLQFCNQFSARTGITCACSIEDSLDFSQVSAENQLHLFRMVQESFNNIEKHSGSKRSSLVVRSSSRQEGILILVSDEGVGLNTHAASSSYCEGLGMRSIRQRAAIIGAKIDFISERGNGLMVRMEYTPGDFGVQNG